MTLKSKIRKAALTTGMVSATTLASMGLSSVSADVPMVVIVPLSAIGGIVGARQLIKELKEESKKKKLKKVI
jgi:hypothetical protein